MAENERAYKEPVHVSFCLFSIQVISQNILSHLLSISIHVTQTLKMSTSQKLVLAIGGTGAQGVPVVRGIESIFSIG